MKWWLIAALAAGGMTGCIEDNDAPVMEPEPGEPEPGEPEPQPGEPEPQPGEPEPQPGEPEPQPGEPEPQPGEPEPQPGEPEPQPGEPEPGEPEPQPEPESPEPESPEPESPEPESPEPIEDCDAACDYVLRCVDEQCMLPADEDLGAQCLEQCNAIPGAVQLLANINSCEELVDTLIPLLPELAEVCEAPPEPGCAACQRISACYAEECRPLTPALMANCEQQCGELQGAMDAILAGLDTCGEVVETFNNLTPELSELCEAPPEPMCAGCQRIQACYTEECRAPGPELIETCEQQCIQAPGLIDQILGGLETCAEVVETINNLVPEAGALCEDVPPNAGCQQVCERIARDCGVPPDQVDECVQGCNADNPTPEQIECGLTAACEDLQACIDPQQPPPDEQVAQECAQACAVALMCQPNLPPDLDFQAECEQQCILQSTPEQRACVLALDSCDDIEACDEQ